MPGYQNINPMQQNDPNNPNPFLMEYDPHYGLPDKDWERLQRLPAEIKADALKQAKDHYEQAMLEHKSTYAGEIGAGLLNGSSPYYRNAANQMYNVVQRNTPTLNMLLGSALSGGVGFGASAAIANQQRKAVTQRGLDAVSKAMPSLLSHGADVGAGLLNSSMNAGQAAANLAEQRREFEANQPTMGEQIGSGLLRVGGLAASFINPAVGIAMYGAGQALAPDSTSYVSQRSGAYDQWTPGTGQDYLQNNYGGQP